MKFFDWFKKKPNIEGSLPPKDIPLDRTDYMIAKEEWVIEQSTKEILKNKNRWIPYEKRGVAYYNLMKYDNALRDFEMVISKSTKEQAAIYYIALCYLRKSEFKEAEGWFREVLKKNPAMLDAVYNMGIAQTELSMYEEAVKSFTICIDKKHQLSNAYWQRAIAYSFLRKEKEATTDFSLAIELSENTLAANKLPTLAYIYLKINELDKCISICKDLLDSKKGYESMYYYLGYAYYYKKNYSETIKYLSLYIKYNWKNENAYSILISAMLFEYNFNGMFKILQRYQFLAPKAPNVYFAFGQYWTHYKKFDKAKEAYTTAIEAYTAEIEKGKRSSIAFNNRGYTYAELGLYESAIADYNTAIQLDPDFVFAHNNRGFAKYKMGDLPEALADLNKCLELNPEHGIAYYNRGLVYIALNQKDEACRDFARAHELKEPKAAEALATYCNGSDE